MSGRPVLLTAVFCGGALVFCYGRNAFAEPTPAEGKSPSPAAELVEQALDNELAGDSEGRKRLLEQAIAADPQYGPARWHMGQVRRENTWLPAADATAKGADSELTAQYEAKRDEALGNAALELNLAQWCVKSGMADRARLHLWRVLANPKASEGQIKEAARSLDLVSVGGLILTRDELKREQEREKRIADAIGKYRPILAQLQPVIDSGFDEKRDAAVAKLASIDDAAVIPAIETYLSDHREGFGEELVKLLTRLPQAEATRTLVRYAVVSRFLSVRERAIAELKKRPLHDYVPTLLIGLVAPIQSQYRVHVAPNGTIRYEHVFLQEGPSARRVSQQRLALNPTTSSRITVFTNVPDDRRFESISTTFVGPDLALFELSLEVAGREGAAFAHNAESQRNNDRIFDVLAQTADPQVPRNAEQCWKWWQDYNQVNYPKPTQYYFSSAQRTYVTAYQSGVRAQHSCFVRGTPVWTQSGLRAIETIRPGDRVLSQDTDTGELTFKLVNVKTVTPPSEASTLTVNGEMITTTLGHPLWVTGKGWEMAKHVKEGDQLHGIGGIVNVNSIEPLANEVEAHNLVVDDFNTYFVGNCGMLVHDNTYRKPTRAIVPGLVP